MKLTKKQRAELRDKFGGRCAYCGVDLPEQWHADHYEAVQRGVSSYVTGRDALHPENHRMENMMPSCPPCNISKGSMSLEVWREWLAGHVNSLNAYHPIYRLAKAYGLIQETGEPVVFYFEKFGHRQA
ncbi:HNH endonuclease [Pseudomonas sp. BDPW]|uniref:HNH endonuclease n=1 Tax=Pseudomonas sp. BDPW TaxID=2806612 RepID=UPI00193B5C38|nr:HNH endonuclease [Pseudomonas sp. BDPW]MBM2596507.1 HNH endonuclease [Pseudomonas sp. BDPW]